MPSKSEPAAHNWSTLDSLEGVPEWPQPKETPAERAARSSLLEKGHALFAQVGTLLPGLALAVGLALAGKVLASWLGTDLLGFSPNPISEISVAIILGLLIRNSIGLPPTYEKGLRLCGKEILRFGIILLGLRLSLIAVFKLGGLALPIILVCIITALFVVTRLNRMLGLPGRLGSLIAVGTSICGVSAIVATAPVIEAEEDEVSYAVACVTLFGLLALFLYPLLAFHLFEEPKLAGLFLGTSIHDTAQVAGAGLMYEKQYQAPEALKTATVVKLVRNLCMVGVIPLVGAWYLRSSHGERKQGKLKLAQLVPLFVLGFLAAAAVRTLGDIGEAEGSPAFGFIDREQWKKQFLAGADILAGWCLTVAMASVGLGTGLGRILKLGAKPFCVGLAAALLVGGVSVLLIKLLM
jgi:uncharacterized integral membrane protein (TIGR00698 family)